MFIFRLDKARRGAVAYTDIDHLGVEGHAIVRSGNPGAEAQELLRPLSRRRPEIDIPMSATYANRGPKPIAHQPLGTLLRRVPTPGGQPSRPCRYRELRAERRQVEVEEPDLWAVTQRGDPRGDAGAGRCVPGANGPL